MKLISITGTKGKTTIAKIIAKVIFQLGENVLLVDSSGHYINQKKRSTALENYNLFQKTPTVCPGKYLITMKNYFPNFWAVFETSVGSRGEGLGYRKHDTGIFTNVFEDHIQKHKNIKNKKDLAEAKNFIFKRIKKNGWAIFNADTKYVCSELKNIPKDKGIRLLPVGISFKYFDFKKHLKMGGEIVTIEDDWVIIKNQRATKRILKYKDIPWTIDGLFLPSLYNLLFSVSGLYSLLDKKLFKKSIQKIKKYQMEEEAGRLVSLKSKKGDIKIIIDYAHEKESLKEIASLGNKVKKNNLIGVLRLAPNIRNERIEKIANYIGTSYDHFIIYDKIDGVDRKNYMEDSGFTRKIGEVSKIFSNSLKSISNKKVERIIKESEAIKKAARVAREGDIVIIIWNSSPQKTLIETKKAFKATPIGNNVLLKDIHLS